MAWQEQLEALEIDNSNMPNMIRKVVKELYEFQSASERISKILDRDDLSEAKREQYEEELEQLDEAIEQQERVIENKIALWEKNKDSYAERIKKMHEANAKKKGGVVKTEATQQQAPPSAPAGVEVQKPNEPTPPASEPKKKGGFGWIALGIVVAVLTAGAVIINKDE